MEETRRRTLGRLKIHLSRYSRGGCQHDGVGEKEVHGEEERHGRLEPTGTNVLQHCTRQKGKEEDMNITYIYTYIPPFFYTANWCAQEDPAVGVAC